MTLLVLAAGMGSRYGGLKQIDPITENGEFIIDFSVYDALRAGFDRVVFIIKEENYDVFHETIGSRIANYIKVDYAFQSLDKIVPADKIPAGRTKPWGTAQAILCAEDKINDGFAVINADDFYGADAYRRAAEFIKAHEDKLDQPEYCMVGYRLGNTLTDNGSVARGVCVKDENGNLTSIVERTKIYKTADGAKAVLDDGSEIALPDDSVVSMNFWGFTPAVFKGVREEFDKFIDDQTREPMKSECYLPNVMGQLINRGECNVKVLDTTAVWHGVTYQQDKPYVVEKIKALIDAGEYKNGLWK